MFSALVVVICLWDGFHSMLLGMMLHKNDRYILSLQPVCSFHRRLSVDNMQVDGAINPTFIPSLDDRGNSCFGSCSLILVSAFTSRFKLYECFEVELVQENIFDRPSSKLGMRILESTTS